MDSSQQNLEAICDRVANVLALEASKDVPEDLQGKLTELINILPHSAHAVAVAEMLYSEKLMQLTESNQYLKLSATDKKMIFAGKAKKEIYYVTLTERQNKSIVHSIDALRSLLSFLKAEITNLH